MPFAAMLLVTTRKASGVCLQLRTSTLVLSTLEYITLCVPGPLQHNRAAHTARRSKAVSHFCSSSFFLRLCARRYDIQYSRGEGLDPCPRQVVS